MGEPKRRIKDSERAYRLAYSRGYNAGRANRWHALKPPEPPNGIVADLLASAKALRDAVANECATFMPNDPIVEALTPYVDALDGALGRLSEWLERPDA